MFLGGLKTFIKRNLNQIEIPTPNCLFIVRQFIVVAALFCLLSNNSGGLTFSGLFFWMAVLRLGDLVRPVIHPSFLIYEYELVFSRMLCICGIVMLLYIF